MCEWKCLQEEEKHRYVYVYYVMHVNVCIARCLCKQKRYAARENETECMDEDLWSDTL